MARAERPLDGDDSRLLEFAADLRQLRAKAGRPAYRELSRRAHYSAAALSDAAAGRRLPSLSVTLAYVAACAGDTAGWERRWRALASELAEAGAQRDDEPAPYVGLAMFQREDANKFFGREALVVELADRVARQRFVVVVGPSGSGKSSLLRAGLVPARRGVGPTVVLTPGPHPLEECAAHLAALVGRPRTELHAALRNDPRCLHQIISQALASAEDGEVLLVVDQFEEVFTLCRDPDERAQFLVALHTAARESTSRTRIVVGLRADFYAHCAQYPELVEALRDAQVLVGPMSTEELRLAITQPALNSGCRVETALVSRVIAEATGQPGVLPLVSHAMLETWRRRRGTTLTLAGFDAAGGITESIARTAETVFLDLSEQEQRWARRLFLRLVALGEGTEDTRRRVGRAELDLTEPGRAAVLERFARARLITVDRDTVELTHEALIRCWPRLHGWLTDNREGVRIHRRLTEACGAWEESHRDPGTLYRGHRLTQADKWASTGGENALSATEREFLRASVAAHTHERATARRRTRRLRQLLALLVVLLVMTTAATVYAVRAQQVTAHQRTIAIAQKVLSQAAALRATNPALAMQLSLAAHRLSPLPEARDALLNIFTTPYATRLTQHTDVLRSIAFSADGRTMMTAGRDHVVRVWDTANPHRPRELATITERGILAEAALSQDGNTVVTTGNERNVLLWDITDRGQPRRLASLDGKSRHTSGVAVSPDGNTVAIAGGTDDYRGTIELWDISDRGHPREQAAITGQFGEVSQVAFMPTGNVLASANSVNADVIATGHEVRLWDVTNRGAPRELSVVSGFTGNVETVFSPDGHTAAMAQQDDHVVLWDLTDVRHPRKVATLTGFTGSVFTTAFSSDGRTLATEGSDRIILLWDVTNVDDPRVIATLTGFTGGVSAMAFSPDGRTLVAGATDNTVRLEDITQYASSTRAHGAASSVVFHPDGRTVATTHDDGTVAVWDAGDPYYLKERLSFTANAKNLPVISTMFSPDGRLLATADSDGNLSLWNALGAGGAPTSDPVIVSRASPLDHAVSIAFSPDGHLLAAGNVDGMVDLWDVSDIRHPRRTATFTGSTRAVRSVAFSPTSHTLATASPTSTQLWDVSDPSRPRNTISITGSEGHANSLAFSPDGRTLVTGNTDRAARLWDITDAQRPRTLTTLTSHRVVADVAVSPDGRTVAVGFSDSTVALWAVTNPRQPQSLGGLTGSTRGGHGIGSMSFHPNNHILAAADNGPAIRLWDIDTEQVTTRLCQLAWPAITPAEWERYFPGITYQPPCP